MLKKLQDPHLAILSYPSTPHPWCGRSPAELCMGCNVRSTIPLTRAKLIPQWNYLCEFRQKNAQFKAKQKKQFDRQHRVVEQDDIPEGTSVWITSESNTIPGTVVSTGESPRSYVVETPTGEVQRNWVHLNAVPETNSEEPSVNKSFPPRVIMTRSRMGTSVHPPERLAWRGDVVWCNTVTLNSYLLLIIIICYCNYQLL